LRARTRRQGIASASAFGCALALVSAPSHAQPAVGGQFQVNTYTTDRQARPKVAAEANGDFVVIWQSQSSPGTDTSSYSIQGQRYRANGNKLGAQFQVNSYTTSYQNHASVASDSDGDFVVAWVSTGSAGTDTSAYSIQGQRYSASGTAQGLQFQVNTYTTSYQNDPRIGIDSDGDFVVVWWSAGSSGGDTDSFSIQGQRYAANGTPQGTEFQVNTYTTGQQTYPDVASDAAGNFVVVWPSAGSAGTDTSGSSIQARRYAANGTPQGAEFQVNTYTTGSQFYPGVAVNGSGAFVVVWQSEGSFGNDSAGTSIQGQRYAANGTAQGGQFQVNTYTTNYQVDANVAIDASGDFVVVWDGYGSVGNDNDNGSIHARRFAANGTPEGDEFQVNTYTTSGQFRHGVAADVDRNFVVVWSSNGSFGNDTSFNSIQLQLYRLFTTAVPSLSPTAIGALGATLLLVGARAVARRR
jgi:hypothetical protein